jgi:hypothetical protein
VIGATDSEPDTGSLDSLNRLIGKIGLLIQREAKTNGKQSRLYEHLVQRRKAAEADRKAMIKPKPRKARAIKPDSDLGPIFYFASGQSCEPIFKKRK